MYPAIGYSYDGDPEFGGHRFVGGIALGGLMREVLSLSYFPRLVAGSIASAPSGIGFRHGLVLDLHVPEIKGGKIGQLVGVEVCHQLMTLPNGLDHDLQALVFINPAFLLNLFLSVGR